MNLPPPTVSPLPPHLLFSISPSFQHFPFFLSISPLFHLLLFFIISLSSLSSYYPFDLSSLSELHSSSFPIILYTSPPCHPVPLLLPISPLFFIFSFLIISSPSLFPSPSLCLPPFPLPPSLSSSKFLSLLLPPCYLIPLHCALHVPRIMLLSSLHSPSLPVSSFVSSIILPNTASSHFSISLFLLLLPSLLFAIE